MSDIAREGRKGKYDQKKERKTDPPSTDHNEKTTGTPVHICSGATASALSIYLSYPQFRSKRSKTRTPSHIALHRPGNSYSQMIAMIIIWVRTCTVLCREKKRLSIHTDTKEKGKKKEKKTTQTSPHQPSAITNPLSLPSRAPGSPSTPEQPSA